MIQESATLLCKEHETRDNIGQRVSSYAGKQEPLLAIVNVESSCNSGMSYAGKKEPLLAIVKVESSPNSGMSYAGKKEPLLAIVKVESSRNSGMSYAGKKESLLAIVKVESSPISGMSYAGKQEPLLAIVKVESSRNSGMYYAVKQEPLLAIVKVESSRNSGMSYAGKQEPLLAIVKVENYRNSGKSYDTTILSRPHYKDRCKASERGSPSEIPGGQHQGRFKPCPRVLTTVAEYRQKGEKLFDCMLMLPLQYLNDLRPKWWEMPTLEKAECQLIVVSNAYKQAYCQTFIVVN